MRDCMCHGLPLQVSGFLLKQSWNMRWDLLWQMGLGMDANACRVILVVSTFIVTKNAYEEAKINPIDL